MPALENTNTALEGLSTPTDLGITPDISTPAPSTPLVESTPTPNVESKPATETPAPNDIPKPPEIDFTDFQAALEGRDPTPKSKEVKKEEAKPKVDFTPKKEVAPPTTGRDYSGLDDHEIALLKQSSNEAFSYLKPKVLELKKIKELNAARDAELASLKAGKAVLPDSYYENEEAYVLDPTWKKAASNVQLAGQFQSHWQQQLARIKQGEDWEDLKENNRGGYDKVPGQKATGAADAAVTTWLQQSVYQYQQQQQQAFAVQGAFKSKYQGAVGAIKEATTKHFGAFDDAKNVALIKTKNDLASMVPAEFRNHPMTELALRGITSALAFQHENKQLKLAGTTKQAEATRTAELVKKAGPTDANMEGGTTGKVEPKVDFSDYLKALQGD